MSAKAGDGKFPSSLRQCLVCENLLMNMARCLLIAIASAPSGSKWYPATVQVHRRVPKGIQRQCTAHAKKKDVRSALGPQPLHFIQNARLHYLAALHFKIGPQTNSVNTFTNEIAQKLILQYNVRPNCLTASKLHALESTVIQGVVNTARTTTARMPSPHMNLKNTDDQKVVGQ